MEAGVGVLETSNMVLGEKGTKEVSSVPDKATKKNGNRVEISDKGHLDSQPLSHSSSLRFSVVLL